MQIYELIPRLIRAGLDNDKKNIESIAMMISRKLKKDYPDISNEITKTLSYSNFDNSFARSIDMQPLPVDKESRYSLVHLEEPIELPDPILNEYTTRQLLDFIKERDLIEVFLQQNVIPPNSLLLNGPPGVGKTYIAKWLSYKLDLPLITLDLASSISSYLGRSGQNIKSIFDYTRSENAILFLDELDAIAKRRDDAGDLGELKRLVNVLLKELESLPSTCIVIAATNHPELLDNAIWRRFDCSLSVQMPEEFERKQLFKRHLPKNDIDSSIIDYIASMTNGVNAADICKLCEHIKRKFLLHQNEDKVLLILSEVYKIVIFENRDVKIKTCCMLKEKFSKLTQREISQITNIPLTSVSRYLGKGKGGKK